MKGFYEALAALEEEKGIPKEYMLEKVKAAIAATIRRDKNVPQELVEVEFNEAKDKVRVYIKKDIVEQVLNPSSEITLEEDVYKRQVMVCVFSLFPVRVPPCESIWTAEK